MKAWIWNFRDAVLWESPGGSGGGGGDRSPDVTSFGPTANGGWSVTNSAGVTTTTDARGMQTISRGGGGGGGGDAPAPAQPAQRAPAPPVAPARVTPATTTTTAPVTKIPARTAGPPLGTLTTAPANVGTTTAPAVTGSATGTAGVVGRGLGAAARGAATAAGSATGRAGAVGRETASAQPGRPAQTALDAAPTTRSALANSNASWFGANRAGQVATEGGSRQSSFAPPSRRSAERSSMAALEAAGGVSAVRDAVARDAGRQAANPRSSDPAFTSPSRPSGYRTSNFDPLARGSTSNPDFGARIDTAHEVANSGGLDKGVPASSGIGLAMAAGPAAGFRGRSTVAGTLPAGASGRYGATPVSQPADRSAFHAQESAFQAQEAARSGRTVDLSIGQNRTFSDIANTAPAGSFQPRAGLGSSLGPNYARGMTADAVAGPMSGTRTTLNAPAFDARRSAMNMDTPVRSTASVVMSGPPVASNYTSPERMAAFTQPQPFLRAVRDSLPFAQKDQIPSTTERSRLEDRAQQVPMSFVEMQRMAQEAQNRSMIENPYMAVAGPITADKVRAVDAALATIAKEVRGFRDPYNTVVQGKTPPSPITSMTIREAADYARKNGAVGFAQFTNTKPPKNSRTRDGTLPTIAKAMGFDLDKTLMTPAVQQTLAIGLIQQRANQATRDGVIDLTEFGHALSQEWAAFTSPKTGKGYYDNDRYGNNAYVPASEVRSIAQGLIDSGAVVGGRNVSQMVDASMATNNMAPGMARAPAPTPAAQRGLTEEQERSAAAYEQQMLKDLPAGSVYSAETAPSNPVYGDRFIGFGAGGPFGGLLTGNLFNADGTRSSAGFVGSTGDGDGRGPWGQSGAAGDDPAPTTEPPPPPAVNVVEASRRFVDDYIYPTPPVKWPARQLTFQR